MILWGLQTSRLTVPRTQSVTLGCLNFIRQPRKMHRTDFLLHALAPKCRLTDSSAVGGMSPFIFPTARLPLWSCDVQSKSVSHVSMCKTRWRQRCGGVVLLSTRGICQRVCVCEHAVFACACGCARSYTINRWAASKRVVHVTQSITQLFNAIRVGFHMEKTLKHSICWSWVVYFSEKLEE